MISTIFYFATLLSIINGKQYNDNSAYGCSGGACLATSHAFKNAINETEIDYVSTSPDEILEYHFHVYFFQDNSVSVNAAKWIQTQLISKVTNHEFLVVLNGIDDTILPDLNASTVPLFNMAPIGPHPCGSFEVWVAKEYFVETLSWFMVNRGDLSILLHPLTPNEVEDHYGRAMWLGTPFRIDLTVLVADDGPIRGSEYPELKLGYDYNANSIYSPQNWLSSSNTN